MPAPPAARPDVADLSAWFALEPDAHAALRRWAAERAEAHTPHSTTAEIIQAAAECEAYVLRGRVSDHEREAHFRALQDQQRAEIERQRAGSAFQHGLDRREIGSGGEALGNIPGEDGSLVDAGGIGSLGDKGRGEGCAGVPEERLSDAQVGVHLHTESPSVGGTTKVADAEGPGNRPFAEGLTEVQSELRAIRLALEHLTTLLTVRFGGAA